MAAWALFPHQRLVASRLAFARATTNSPGEITGTISNRSGTVQHDVRISIDLLNAHNEVLWQATAYVPQVPPASNAAFRALVIDPAAATARVARITALR